MLAPCPPTVRLDEGGNYNPSKAQRWLWDLWKDFWVQVENQRKQYKADLYVVSNGDAVEGNHHQTTQILSGNLEAQSYVLEEAFKIPLAFKPERIFIVRGTETHVGPAASHEEALGRKLQAERDPDTHTWSWWELRLDIYGIRIDCRHHCTIGGKPWTRGGIATLAYQIWSEHAENDLPYPHLAIRSHKHQHRDSFDIHKTRAIVAPAWQLLTSHAHKVVTESIADIGGLIVTVFPEGRYEVKVVRHRPTPTPAWRGPR